MTLINCPNCGKEILENENFCPHCEYTITDNKTTKFNKVIEKLFPKKGQIFLLLFFLVIAIVVIGKFSSSPADKTMNIIKNDLAGEKITFERIYYNKEDNVSIAYITRQYDEDIATVYLDRKEVGYESVYDAISAMMDATSGEVKTAFAMELISYTYDPVRVSNLVLNGSSWELIYQK